MALLHHPQSLEPSNPLRGYQTGSHCWRDPRTSSNNISVFSQAIHSQFTRSHVSKLTAQFEFILSRTLQKQRQRIQASQQCQIQKTVSLKQWVISVMPNAVSNLIEKLFELHSPNSQPENNNKSKQPMRQKWTFPEMPKPNPPSQLLRENRNLLAKLNQNYCVIQKLQLTIIRLKDQIKSQMDECHRLNAVVSRQGQLLKSQAYSMKYHYSTNRMTHKLLSRQTLDNTLSRSILLKNQTETEGNYPQQQQEVESENEFKVKAGINQSESAINNHYRNDEQLSFIKVNDQKHKRFQQLSAIMFDDSVIQLPVQSQLRKQVTKFHDSSTQSEKALLQIPNSTKEKLQTKQIAVQYCCGEQEQSEKRLLSIETEDNQQEYPHSTDISSHSNEILNNNWESKVTESTKQPEATEIAILKSLVRHYEDSLQSVKEELKCVRTKYTHLIRVFNEKCDD